MKTVLEANNIVKKYNSAGNIVEVLKGIDFSIDEGSFTTIFGASGLGKTTFLNCIGGLTNVDEGNISINIGDSLVDLTELSEEETNTFRRKYLGFIFQFYNLIPTLNTLENVELAARFAGIKNPSLKAKELLIEVGLGDRLKQYPGTLSGGEQQRVAIARALVKNPILILADEITGNIDSQRSEVIFKLLKNLVESRNIALIMATHDSMVSKYIRGKIYRIDQGKFVEIEGDEQI